MARDSIGIVTALGPALGYEGLLAHSRSARSPNRRGVAEIVLEEGLLTETEISELLRVDAMTVPSRPKARHPPAA